MLTLEKPTTPVQRSLILPPMMPFEDILRLRMRLRKSNVLFPRQPFDSQDLGELAGDPVMAMLPDYKFSDYSMEPSSLAYLKNVFESFRPTTVVELGSGISTAILSHLLMTLHEPGTFIRYVTIDQSQDYADQTNAMLERVGTTDIVRTMIAETKPMTVHGRETACYDIQADELVDALDGHQAELFIIDGPTGGGVNGFEGARFATAPLLKPVAAHEALFFLDDALRDTELEIAAAWAQLDYLNVLGLKAVGKGTLVGCYLDTGS